MVRARKMFRVLGEAACVNGMVMLGRARLVADHVVQGRVGRLRMKNGL